VILREGTGMSATKRLSSKIRNVVAAPVPGQPGLSLLTLYSPALRRRADITLFVPPGTQDRSLPLLILMHGVYGSHWNWWALGNLPEIATRLLRKGAIGAFAIAMPSDGMRGDGSAYVVHGDLDAEAWIMQDVPACVKEVQPGVQTERVFLAGQSMGGFGALRLGAKYARRVAGVSAHSPVPALPDLMPYVSGSLRDYEKAGKRDTDILYWIRRNRAILPPMRFDCGTEDALIGSNRELHAALTREKIAHVYEEHPGGHDWSYWQEHVGSTLRFFSRLATGSGRAL
jgi:putative tributyrin esterase